MPVQEKSRIDYIDFLKFIGLSAIVLAHVSPPEWLLMLRSFDVPLMVMLSAMLAGRSYEKKRISAGQYLASRFSRLVFPVWLFLLLYFTLEWLSGEPLHSLKHYLLSFGLTRYGINYVWVILIYLYSAAAVLLCQRTELSPRNSAILLAVYLLYEGACHHRLGMSSRLVVSTVYYFVPYGLLTFLGCRHSQIRAVYRRWIMAISAVVFICLCVFYYKEAGEFQPVSIAKYPPTAYYLSYGIFCSFGLLEICARCPRKFYSHPLIRYISAHSMWIYLWHILVLRFYEKLHLPHRWYIKLMIVYACTVAITYGVNRILDHLEQAGRYPSFLRYLRG